MTSADFWLFSYLSPDRLPSYLACQPDLPG